MQFEEHKYLPPKFSQILSPLAAEVGLSTQFKIEEQANEEARGEGEEKIGSTAYSQPKLLPVRDKTVIFTHRRAKTNASHASRSSKRRPDTSTQVRAETK